MMDKDTMRRLDKGREHYENREYDKAETYLLKVLEADVEFADVANMLGVIYHDKGKVALAQEYFEKALRINPKYTEAALNLAVTYNEQGRYSQAKQIHAHVSTLTAGLTKEIEPYARGKLANMHSDLGLAYAELQLYDEAVEQLKRALALCPDFVDIRTRLGQILKDAEKLSEACEEFEKVKVLRPEYLPARISLGVAYFALEDKDLAQKEWKSVLKIDPKNKTASMYLKVVEQMLAQEEALEAGISLDITDIAKPTEKQDDELAFSFGGETSSLKPAGDKSETTESEKKDS